MYIAFLGRETGKHIRYENLFFAHKNTGANAAVLGAHIFKFIILYFRFGDKLGIGI